MMLLHCSPHDTFVIIKALAENFKACTSRSLFLLKRGRRIVLTSFKLYIVVTTRCTTKHTNQQLSCFLLYIAVHTLATKCTSGMENRYYKKYLGSLSPFLWQKSNHLLSDILYLNMPVLHIWSYI